MLTEVDGPVLAMLCENLSDYWGLRAELESVTEENQGIMSSADLLMMRAKVTDTLSRLDVRVKDWLGEMLMTPMSRSKAQPVRAEVEQQRMDLSELDKDERQQLREMLVKRREQRVLN